MNQSVTAPADFSSLLSDRPDQRAGLKPLIEKINQSGGTYHQLDFGDGRVISGHYDMFKVLDYYRLPGSLAGLTALDVGSASGFFALECARRGAQVQAIDIYESTPLDDLEPHLKC